jgi:hypothetical protein
VEVESHTALPLLPRSSPFPEEWGTPPRRVDERRAWAVRNIRAGEVRARRGERVPWLPAKASRPLSGREALRRMQTRLDNEHQLRMLRLLELEASPLEARAFG